MLPVSRAASEGDGQNSGPTNRMRSLPWYRQAPKPPLTPQDFSMFIRRQYRGFWLGLVPGLYQDSGMMHLYYTPPIVKCTLLSENGLRHSGLVLMACDGFSIISPVAGRSLLLFAVLVSW